MSNFAAALSSLQPGDIYSMNPKLFPAGKQYTDDIVSALKEFALIVRIGKGPGAGEVRLDLPPFTFMAITNKMSEVPKAYLPLFENVIEIKVDKHEICKMEIQIVASELDMKIQPSAIEIIALETKNDMTQATNYVKRINDYLLVKGKSGEIVTTDLARDIISQFV